MSAQTYTDLSALKEEDESLATISSSKKDYKFPVRLHYALEVMENDGLQHIASWMPHGRSFKVHSPSEFERACLPLWFRQTKYKSFQRQLNIYGFTRIAAGPDKGSYYHEAFLFGKRFLASRIPCIKIKGKKHEPCVDIDFYSMPQLQKNASFPEASKPNRVEPDNSAPSGDLMPAVSNVTGDTQSINKRRLAALCAFHPTPYQANSLLLTPLVGGPDLVPSRQLTIPALHANSFLQFGPSCTRSRDSNLRNVLKTTLSQNQLILQQRLERLGYPARAMTGREYGC